MSGISDRAQEIKRRRKRRKTLAEFSKKLKKATASDKVVMADKIRKMTPGAEVIITNFGLEER